MDSAHEGGSWLFIAHFSLLLGGEIPAVVSLEFLDWMTTFFFSSRGTGQNDTHQRFTGLLLCFWH
jgi:hypothetical protein